MRLPLIAVAGLALALGGCQSNPKLDASIQQNLPKICASAASIHTAFVTVAATGKIPAKAISKEAAAFAAVKRLCADPTNVNSSNLLVVAAEAYAAAMNALKAAQ